MQTNVRQLSRKTIFVSLGITLLVVVSIITVLELTNTTFIFHNKYIPPLSAGQSTKGESKSLTTTSPSTRPSDTTGAASSTNNPEGPKNYNPALAVGGQFPAVPSGDFVSNHRPSVSGSPAPNTMSSVCKTSPGATCAITFTKGDTTKSLMAQTTDSEGATYWDWKINTVGLTAGTWKIQAVATFNDKTITATDAIDLEVSP